MRVDGSSGLARDHGSHHVADGQRLRALGFGFTLGGDGVGGFAGLRNQQRQLIRTQDWIAVAPFAGVIDFDRNAGQVLDHELAGQSGVPTGAAGGDIDLLQSFELGFTDLHLVEKDGAGVLRDAAERGVADGARLLINLFEHEVLEAALLRHDGIPGDALRFALQRIAVEIGNLYAILRDHGQIAIGQEEKIAGVIEKRGHVGGDEVFIFADADHGGRSVAGRDNLVRFVNRDHHQREHAGKFLHRFTHCFFQQRPMAVSGLQVVLLHQVRDDFGVGFGGKFVPFGS